MDKQVIGFWGYPDPEIISKLKSDFPQAQWLDLDIDFGYPDSGILPDAYCRIIKNIVNNSMFLKNDIFKIVATIGKDKCDSGWFAAKVLADLGFDVVESAYEVLIPMKEIRISTSNLPLIEKINAITGNIIEPTTLQLEQCKAKFGFWGVPPNDLEILNLFPNETHVFGWTRCVEAGTPANVELEMYVDENIPTVFYSQAFCAKSQLAKYLADKYDGLYIDIDDYATNSIKAKIEAFFEVKIDMGKFYLDAGTTYSKIVAYQSSLDNSYSLYFIKERGDKSYYIVPSKLIKKLDIEFSKICGHMGLTKCLSGTCENEIIALANGCKSRVDENSTVLDLGSRDAKWVSFKDGKFKDMDWNTSCASSTGATVEMLLKFYDIDIDDLAFEKDKFPVTCGIFGMEKIMDDISKGADASVAISKFIHGLAYNAWSFAKKPEKLYLSGGFCENKCFVDSLKNYCEVELLGRFVLCEGLIHGE